MKPSPVDWNKMQRLEGTGVAGSLGSNRRQPRRTTAIFAMLATALVGSSCAYTTVTLVPTVPPNAEASVVLAANGTLLTTLHAGENRTEISLDQVPRHVQDALVAIEDRRFWSHAGIDLKAILRAARTNIDEGAVVEGGSTITQQFVKNALLASDRTLDRKIEEATLSIQVEREYSKEEILEYYLNTVYFGAGAYGIEAASHVYFDKPATDLTVAEGAMLAGLVKAPSTNDPFVNGEGALARRQLVLEAMVDEGYLTTEEGRVHSSTNIELAAPDPDDTYRGAYFVEEVKRFVLDSPAFGRTREERARRLFTGGLTIETSLDLDLQEQAEHAATLVLSDPANDPDTAIVTLDPTNGYVLAMVGGRDFFDGGPRSKFNLATQARRPAGSSFKPLVLAAAIEEGIPVSQVYSAPATIKIPVTNDVWEVENYGGSSGGNVNLIEATVRSYNTAYAQLVMDVGPADAVSMAAHLGVTSPLLAVPSSVLGANDVSPLDMASAYSTFANRGVRNEPVYVTRVLGSDGEILFQHDGSPVRAIERSTADEITAILQQVVSRGTGVRARIGRPVAGKTGTGQNWGDAWFVGYTPDLVTSVWVGFAEAQISMVPPTTRLRVTGGTWPAEIWQLYMTAALAETPITDFVAGEEIEQLDGSDREGPAAINASEPLVPGELVQDVVGMPIGLATEILTRAGFVVVTENVPNDEYPPDVIADQRPIGESIVETGSEITLHVANGQRVRRVPSVLGLDEERATEAISHAGYLAEIKHQAEADPRAAELRPGQVWKVDPATAAALAPGESVTIWLNP
jgi:penicillin-binding protein 1A